MPRRFRGVHSKHKTKRVIRRSMYEHVQGGTVRIVDDRDLPTGCAHLTGDGLPIPCSGRMVAIEATTEFRFDPVEQQSRYVVKLIGWCKRHRPRIVQNVMMQLPEEMVKRLNGPKSQKARIRKQEEVMYTKVVSKTGSIIHLASREEVGQLYGSQKTVSDVTTACGKVVKRAYLISPTEIKAGEYNHCVVCPERTKVVDDEM